MGLAASQARLLFITGRKSDVEYSQMKIANEKISLSRESTAEAEEYARALSQRKLTWTTGADTSADLGYNLLMTPNANVSSGQYLVTDVNGRVLLSDEYKTKLNLSASVGTAGQFKQAYPSTAGFLVAVMGISAADANQYVAASGNSANFSDITEPVIEGDIDNLGKAMGDPQFSASGSCTLPEDVYYNMKPTLTSMLEKVNTALSLDSIEAGKKEIYTKLKNDIVQAQRALEAARGAKTSTAEGREVAMAAIATLKALFDGTTAQSSLPDARIHPSSKKMDGVPYTARTFIWPVRGYANTNEQGASTAKMQNDYFNTSTGLGNINYSVPYNNNISDLADSLQYFDTKVPTSSTLTAQDTADYYVNLYNALGSKGWKCDSNISDKDYMQNGIRNGNFYIQQLKSTGWAALSTGDASSPVNDVLDEAKIAQAEAKHEVAQSKLSTKEEQLDLKLKNLDTERAALDTEVDSVKAVINKNIERSFKLFQNG